MINYVKGFGQFINEARFHHALPNSAGDVNSRLRDEFRALSLEEQGEIESLAADLEKEGILSDFKKTMSRYNSIAQVKDSMIAALHGESDDDDYTDPQDIESDYSNRDYDFESPFCKSCEGTGCEECDESGMKRNPIGRF